MKRLNFARKKGASRGFYIALALSAAAVGTMTYLTLHAAKEKPEPPSGTLENTAEWSIPEVDAAEKPQPGVPKDTPKVILRESEPEPEPKPQEETPVLVPKPQPAKPAEKPSPGGAFIMPVSGEILHPFSGGELVKSKTLHEWRTHDGIDIAAKEGTPVKSPNDGKVLDIREDSQWGNTVEAEYDGGLVISFCGMGADVKVKKGQSLKLGDVIGTVGNSSIVEAAEPSHLHVGIRKDGKWVDPMSVLTKN